MIATARLRAPSMLYLLGFLLLFHSCLTAGVGARHASPVHPSERSTVPGSPTLVLMCLSAHPDDEDGGALAYYSRLKGIKAYSIFFTRGEGGQNEIGSELYDDL